MTATMFIDIMVIMTIATPLWCSHKLLYATCNRTSPTGRFVTASKFPFSCNDNLEIGLFHSVLFYLFFF